MDISVADLAMVIDLYGPYYRWIGNYGYDTRPYAEWRPEQWTPIYGQRAPVAYEEAYASHGRESYQVPKAGDTVEWLNDLPVGAKLIIPDSNGAYNSGEHHYCKEENGWVSLGYLPCGVPEFGYGHWDYRPIDGGLQVVKWGHS